MPRQRQSEGRRRRRIEVRYAVAGGGAAGRVPQIGYTGNLSVHGMMIRTPRVLPPGTLLTIDLRFPGRTLTVSGRVVWARQGPIEWLSTGKVGMGVRFVDPPAELADLVAAAAPSAGAAATDGKR